LHCIKLKSEPVKLFIKNMVCDRCKMIVKSELESLGLHPELVELGEVTLTETVLTEEQRTLTDGRLRALGFELLDDAKAKMIEKIKTAVIELIHYEDEDNHVKYSEYLTRQVGKDYPFMSKVFSEAEGITIEQYIIQQKVEKVKELLTYGELTLSEIAWQMGYSSVAAISTQFKKVTGMTPREYKSVDDKGRKQLDSIGK
jgi:AraC family transcriptional regulator